MHQQNPGCKKIYSIIIQSHYCRALQKMFGLGPTHTYGQVHTFQ